MTAHGVTSIDAQIKKGKFKLANVDKWLPKIGRHRLDFDVHTRSEGARQQFRNVSQYSREVCRFLLQFLATGKRQKPLRKSSSKLRDLHQGCCQPTHLLGNPHGH